MSPTSPMILMILMIPTIPMKSLKTFSPFSMHNPTPTIYMLLTRFQIAQSTYNNYDNFVLILMIESPT